MMSSNISQHAVAAMTGLQPSPPRSSSASNGAGKVRRGGGRHKAPTPKSAAAPSTSGAPVKAAGNAPHQQHLASAQQALNAGNHNQAANHFLMAANALKKMSARKAGASVPSPAPAVTAPAAQPDPDGDGSMY